MGLLYRVNCDVRGCAASDKLGARDSAEVVEALALSLGWIRAPDGKWFCPDHQSGGGLKIYFWDCVVALQNHAEGHVFAVAATKEQAIELACAEWFDDNEPQGEPVFTGMEEKYPGQFADLRASHKLSGLQRQADAVAELRAELLTKEPQILSTVRAIVIPGSS